MKFHLMLELIGPLLQDERRMVRKKLLTFGNGKKSKAVALYDQLCKLSGRREPAEKQLRAQLGWPSKIYCNVRGDLLGRLLEAVADLRADTRGSVLVKKFEIAFLQDFLPEMAKEYFAAIDDCLASDHFLEAAELLHLGESLKRLSKPDKRMARLAEYPPSYELKGIYGEEVVLERCLHRFRVAWREKAGNFAFVVSSIRGEMAGMEPRSFRGKYLQQAVEARLLALEGNYETAADTGCGLVDWLNEAESNRKMEIVDELAFLIPLLIGVGRNFEAWEYASILSEIDCTGKLLRNRKINLELDSLTSLADKTWNVEVAEKALAILAQHHQDLPPKSVANGIYFTSLTLFAHGHFEACNKTLVLSQSYGVPKEDRLDWQSDCLALLSFIDRDNPWAISLIEAFKKKKSIRKDSYQYLIYTSIHKLLTIAEKEQSTFLSELIRQLEMGEGVNISSTDKRYLDFFSILKAKQMGINLADLPEYANRTLRKAI